MKFHATKHFYERLDARDLTYLSCKDAVTYCDKKTIQKGQKCCHGGKLCVFEKLVGGRKLVVVAEVLKNEVWMITAYHEW